MGDDSLFQLIVVLLFDEKVSFKAWRFELGEFCRNHVVIFVPSPQQRTDKPRGIIPGNLPRHVDARKIGIYFHFERPCFKQSQTLDKIFVRGQNICPDSHPDKYFFLGQIVEPQKKGKRPFIKENGNDWLFIVSGLKFGINKSYKFR